MVQSMQMRQILLLFCLWLIIPASHAVSEPCTDMDYRFIGMARTQNGFVAMLKSGNKSFLVKEGDVLDNGDRILKIDFYFVYYQRGEERHSLTPCADPKEYDTIREVVTHELPSLHTRRDDHSPYIVGPIILENTILEYAMIKVSQAAGGASFLMDIDTASLCPHDGLSFIIAHQTMNNALTMITESCGLVWTEVSDTYVVRPDTPYPPPSNHFEDKSSYIAGTVLFWGTSLPEALILVSEVIGDIFIEFDSDVEKKIIWGGISHTTFYEFLDALTITIGATWKQDEDKYKIFFF